MKKRNILTAIIFMSFLYATTAQELLTPENAIAIAVDKNFDIQLAKNESEIATINNNKGAAGMLPYINGSTGDVFYLNNINQEFTTGDKVKKNYVPVNSFTAGVNMNWVVFDGLKMFATKDRLEALQSVGEIQLKESIQNTVAQVLNMYYNVVRQKQQIKALKETVAISEERVKISQKKLDVGYADKTPLLQAKVDMSQSQTDILRQEILLQKAKSDLNQLLGRASELDFEVIDSIVVNYDPVLQSIKDSAEVKNYSLLSQKKYIDIAKLERKEINSQRMPFINFTTGYNFSQNNSKAGLQLFNRTYGPTVGMSAIIPIYNAGVVKKQLQASTVNIASQQIVLDQLKNDLDNRILTIYRDFLNAKEILEMNIESVKIAKENLDVSVERYRLSQANSLEIREAQSSYEDAQYNVILSSFNCKLAETELKRITNELVK